MEKKEHKLETNSRQESLIIDHMTEQKIQDFIDKDYSWASVLDSKYDGGLPFKEAHTNTEPDWTPNL
jgi:hypothetical protein